MAVSQIPPVSRRAFRPCGGKIPDGQGTNAGSGSVISLRSRILLLLVALIAANLIGAGLSIWYTDRARGIYESTIEHDFQALMAAQGLETALLMQKGLTTYFFLNSDPAWLEQLISYEQDFSQFMDQARASTRAPGSLKMLNQIESEYLHFTHARDQVIACTRPASVKQGPGCTGPCATGFHAPSPCARSSKITYQERVLKARTHYNHEARLISLVTLGTIPGVFGLGLVLVYILMKQVLIPPAPPGGGQRTG